MARANQYTKRKPKITLRIEADNTDNSQKAFNYIFTKMLTRLAQERPKKTQLLNAHNQAYNVRKLEAEL